MWHVVQLCVIIIINVFLYNVFLIEKSLKLIYSNYSAPLCTTERMKTVFIVLF